MKYESRATFSHYLDEIILDSSTLPLSLPLTLAGVHTLSSSSITASGEPTETTVKLKE